LAPTIDVAIGVGSVPVTWTSSVTAPGCIVAFCSTVRPGGSVTDRVTSPNPLNVNFIVYAPGGSAVIE
jgi:hypothetical protein